MCYVCMDHVKLDINLLLQNGVFGKSTCKGLSYEGSATDPHYRL
jgi:hypothetical protein